MSGYIEVGWTTSDNSRFPEDGVRLAYFDNSSGGNSKRIAYNGGSAEGRSGRRGRFERRSELQPDSFGAGRDR